MPIKAVFFDSGHTLMRPLGGRWFPCPSFFEICAAHGSPIADDQRLQAACDLGYEFLAAHHDRVPDIDAERRQFDEYYRIVLDALSTGWTETLVGELAAASVNEVDFEPYPTTAWLLDELAARRVPLAVSVTGVWRETDPYSERLEFSGVSPTHVHVRGVEPDVPRAPARHLQSRRDRHWPAR